MNTQVDNPFGNKTPAAAGGASAVALANREVAEVQSAMVIAKRFPRNPQESMDKIISACTRLSLAEKASYQYARGGNDISGPSIRLAEECARGWGNIIAGVAELSRGEGVSECMAYAWDLESGYRDEKRFHVRHWRDTRSGGYAITDERDIYEMVSNSGSRRKRACILAVIPGDVVEAAEKQCELTLRTKVEVTPERIDSMVEKFGKYGVTKDMIEKRIQRRLDAEIIPPAMLLNLGKIYNSLQDGMSSPSDWFDVTPQPGSKTSLSEITGETPDPEPEERSNNDAPTTDADQADDKIGFTAEEIGKMIDGAANKAKLDEAVDLIGALPQNQRKKLRERAVARYAEFVG